MVWKTWQDEMVGCCRVKAVSYLGGTQHVHSLLTPLSYYVVKVRVDVTCIGVEKR